MKKEKSKGQLFVQGSVFLVLSNVCIKAVNFFLLPLYTKNLTPSMLGVSDSISTFVGILYPILILGLDSAYSAFYFEKKDVDRDKKVFSTLGITFFTMGIIPLIMSIWSEKLSELIFRSDQYHLEVMVALVGVTLNLWMLPYSLEMRLKNMMGSFGIISVLCSFSMILLNILFVSVLKLQELSLVLSSAIVAGEHLLLFLLFIRKAPKREFYDFELLKGMLGFAIPLIPTVLMTWVLSLSDRYILLAYQGDQSVGLYGIGARFVTLLNVVIGAVSTAYTTFAFGSKEEENAKGKYYFVFNVMSVTLLFIAFTISIFSKEIISLVADDAYYTSHVIIRDMMFGQVFYAMSTIVSYGFMFFKKSVYSLSSVSAGAIANLILNFLLIPRYGMKAAALTTLIGYLISLLVSYYYSEKCYPCYYGIKRVMGACVILYLVSLLSMEQMVWVRFAIWCIGTVSFILLFRDIIGGIIKFISGYIHPMLRRNG